MSDIDNALTERLPIVLKLQWDDLDNMRGAQTVHQLAELHNRLSSGEFTQQVNVRGFGRGLSPLIDQINALIANSPSAISLRVINKVILDWLAINMPKTLHLLRAKHVTQLAEYVTVCRGIDGKFGETAVQIVGDSLVMNQKAARATKQSNRAPLPQVLIKGRLQYGGSVAEEELAQA